MKNIQEALNEAKPTLIQFFSPECDRCTKSMPIVDELKADKGDKANIIQVNILENPELAKEYKIHTCPTWILFKDNQEVWRDSGVKPLSELADMLNRFI